MRIAIVGSGISGLVAAYLLNRRHDVHVFEAGAHVGGHTYTLGIEDGGREVAVDMGFIVYNERTYPNFCRLLDELGVETQASDMSFAVHCERTGLEYCGSASLNQLFAQRRNLVNVNFYRLIAGILSFHRRSHGLLSIDGAMTLEQYLQRERFPRPFVEHYLMPMISAIWSTDPSKMFDFPVRTLAGFLNNHGMLQIRDRPQWRVVKGGSKRYVERLTRTFADRIRLRSPVARVKRRPHGVEVKVADGTLEEFDAVVFATHSDQALDLLGDAGQAEREILGAIPYQANDVVLHTDARLMPKRPLAWASWNYHLDSGARDRLNGRAAHGKGVAEPPAGPAGSTVTYWMNRLQSLDTERPFFVTLNRTGAIDPDKILHRVEMAHPLFLESSEGAKARWHEINRDRTFFCGAYWGYGFHEDGVKSGLRVAAALGESW